MKKIKVNLELDELAGEAGLPNRLDIKLRDRDERLAVKAIERALRQKHKEVPGIPPYSHNHAVKLLLVDIGKALLGEQPETFQVMILNSD